MQILLQGRYTKQQLRRAFSLEQGRGRRIANLVYILVVFLFLVSEVVGAVVGSVALGTLLWDSLPTLLVLVLLGGGLLGVPRLQAYLVQRAPLYQSPVTGVVSDEDLTLGGGESESRLPWDDCVGYKMSEDLVLLYADSGAFTTVPRAFFATESDWHHFRDRLQRTLPGRTTGPSSILRWLLFALIMLVMAACAILSTLLEVLPLSGP